MKIAVDVMGGDYAPEAVIEGILLSLPSLSNDDTILAVGPQDTIEQLLVKHGYAGTQIAIIPADQVIEMGEHPTKALS